MRRMTIIATTLLASTWALGSPAAAQSVVTNPACDDHENVIKMLDRQYAEAPEALGLQATSCRCSSPRTGRAGRS